MEFNVIRDPVWQFIGVVLSIVGISTSLWAAWRFQRRKRLTHFVRSIQLLSVDDELRDRIQILYDGKPVVDVRLIEFGIQNTGNVPLLPEDFVRPVEFDFGENAQFLTVSDAEMRPSDLAVETRWVGSNVPTSHPSQVSICPLLLNAGDKVALKGLVAGSSTYRVRGRIVGVEKIEREKTESHGVQVLRKWGPLSVMVFIGNLFLAWVVSSAVSKSPMALSSIVLLGIVYLLLWGVWVLLDRRQK